MTLRQETMLWRPSFSPRQSKAKRLATRHLPRRTASESLDVCPITQFKLIVLSRPAQLIPKGCADGVAALPYDFTLPWLCPAIATACWAVERDQAELVLQPVQLEASGASTYGTNADQIRCTPSSRQTTALHPERNASSSSSRLGLVWF